MTPTIRAYRALARSSGGGLSHYGWSSGLKGEKVGVRYASTSAKRAKAIKESEQGSVSINERMPASAKYLGLSGTIPFFATAGVAVWATDPAMAAAACHGCVVYGGSILSFLGAVHWGVALRSPTSSMTRPWDFGYSVCPSLAAAAALSMPDEKALVTLLPAFGAALVYDSARFAAHDQVPKWYPKLRRPLTFAAITSLGICTGVTWEMNKGPTAVVEGSKDGEGSEEFVDVRSVDEASGGTGNAK